MAFGAIIKCLFEDETMIPLNLLASYAANIIFLFVSTIIYPPEDELGGYCNSILVGCGEVSLLISPPESPLISAISRPSGPIDATFDIGWPAHAALSSE